MVSWQLPLDQQIAATKLPKQNHKPKDRDKEAPLLPMPRQNTDRQHDRPKNMEANKSMQNMPIQLKFWSEAATAMREAQGLQYLEALQSITDTQINRLFWVVRNSRQGTPREILKAYQDHLKLYLFYVKHQDWTKRLVTIGDINLPLIRALHDQRELEYYDK